MKTTQGSVGRPKKTTKRTARTITFNGLDDVATGVNTVLHSLINQDGRYTTKEANVISNIYGRHLSLAKIKLDVHKFASKASATKATFKDVLTIT